LKVILTREEEDIKKDKPIFKEAGFEVVELPLIKTRVLEFKIPQEEFDYVVFQSKKAVKVFLSKAKIKKEKIIAVGEKTAKELEKFGYKAHIIPEKEDVYGLIEVFKKLSKGKVLIPRSKIGRQELIDFLEKEGFKVYPLDIYTTESVIYPKKELLNRVNNGKFIIFYSPSAVRAFFANLQIHKIPKEDLNLVYVAIGKTTKTELEKHSVKNVILPEKPGTESVVERLKEVARSLQK